MKFHTLASLTFGLFAVAGSAQSYSQTYRVKIASVNNGPVYTEVYEYDYVDVKPEFPGGSNSFISYINDNRHYPTDAYEMGIQGRVTCAFIVHPDGKLSHIQILRGVENSLNEEAVRLVSSMPDWKPGKINDIPVPVRVVCCIPFRR